MQHTFLRLPQVLAVTGLPRAGLYGQVKDGTFPKPVKIDPRPRSRTVAWVSTEVESWVAARIAARS